MSEGYLSKKREQQLARILDGAVDFNALLGTKKILGVITIGHYLERKDRKLFESFLSFMDDNVIGKEPKQEVVELIEKAVSLLEQGNIKAFLELVADLLSEKITTSFEAFEKQIFFSFLLLFSGVIEKAIAEVKKIEGKADLEDVTI